MKLNNEMLPMMILVVDNKCRVKFIFSWNYNTDIDEKQLLEVIGKIESLMK